jgi:hypothetical protein
MSKIYFSSVITYKDIYLFFLCLYREKKTNTYLLVFPQMNVFATQQLNKNEVLK